VEQPQVPQPPVVVKAESQIACPKCNRPSLSIHNVTEGTSKQFCTHCSHEFKLLES